MNLTRLLSLLLAGVALAATTGCSSDKGFSTKDADRAEYGADWPLGADTATLACEPGGVLTLTIDGVSKGIAQVDLSAPKSDRVAHYLAVVGETDYSVFIPEAMKLCG